jgi:hypothetical protein
VVVIALARANGVPFITVADSKVGEVEYSNAFRVLFPPALITDVNFTDVSVTKEWVCELITGITLVTAPETLFPNVIPEALLASKRM